MAVWGLFLVVFVLVIFEIVFVAGTEEFSGGKRLKFAIPIVLLLSELLGSFLNTLIIHMTSLYFCYEIVIDYLIKSQSICMARG